MNVSHFWIYPTTLEEVTSELILSSIALLEPQEDRVDLSRDNTPDDSWESHLAELQTEEQIGGSFYISSRDVVIPKSRIVSVPSYYIDINLPLIVDFAGSQSRVQLKVLEELEVIDTSIRRDFWASNCAFTFGYHDIYQPASDVRSPDFIARPPASLRLWDYGFIKPDEFLPHFSSLPSIVTLQNDLAKLWGPVKCAITTFHS